LHHILDLLQKSSFQIGNHRCRRSLLFETLPFGKATLREGYANANANDLPLFEAFFVAKLRNERRVSLGYTDEHR
jgi:hypothetical protein